MKICSKILLHSNHKCHSYLVGINVSNDWKDEYEWHLRISSIQVLRWNQVFMFFFTLAITSILVVEFFWRLLSKQWGNSIPFKLSSILKSIFSIIPNITYENWNTMINNITCDCNRNWILPVQTLYWYNTVFLKIGVNEVWMTK